jgi:DNA-directed RNA polymerase specialized sigma24 family protein
MADAPVTILIEKLRYGDPDAVRKLWDRYFPRLVALARERLRTVPRRAADEEDMALSAFKSFYEWVVKGRCPEKIDRNDLWGLLVIFTVRKVSHYIRAERARPCGNGELDEVQGQERDPAEEAEDAEVVEQFERLLTILPDPLLREVALLRLAGHTIDDIGARINRSNSTVDRRLGLIRRFWRREAGEVCDGGE